LKVKIKDFLKSLKTKGFSDTTKKLFSIKDYDRSIVTKVDGEIKKYFDDLFITDMVVVTRTSQYGTESKSYEQDYIGIKGNYIYIFKIGYTPIGGGITGFREVNIDKLSIPKDVISYTISQAGKSYYLSFSKGKIHSNEIGGYKPDTVLFDKVKSYVENKHKDLEVIIKHGNLKIIKKKG